MTYAQTAAIVNKLATSCSAADVERSYQVSCLFVRTVAVYMPSEEVSGCYLKEMPTKKTVCL